MLKLSWKITFLLFTSLLTACSSTPKYQQAMDLSIADYQQSVSREDTGNHLIFSSKDALHNNPGTSDSEHNDNYVVAVINKLSGKTRYQIVNTVGYQAPGWLFYKLAKFVTQEGINEQATKIIDQEVLECSVFSDCTYLETISFEIPEELVIKGAERFQPGNQAGIKYQLISDTQQDYKGIIFAQELIAVYNQVQASKK